MHSTRLFLYAVTASCFEVELFLRFAPLNLQFSVLFALPAPQNQSLRMNRILLLYLESWGMLRHETSGTEGDHWYNQSSLLTVCRIQVLCVRNWHCSVFRRAGLGQVSLFTAIFTTGALYSAGGHCTGHTLLCPQQVPSARTVLIYYPHQPLPSRLTLHLLACSSAVSDIPASPWHTGSSALRRKVQCSLPHPERNYRCVSTEYVFQSG